MPPSQAGAVPGPPLLVFLEGVGLLYGQAEPVFQPGLVCPATSGQKERLIDSTTTSGDGERAEITDRLCAPLGQQECIRG